ncbi:glycosyltransferase family 4 protein [Enterobacter hormaechei]|uniref:glycosyltransferase family 4 protein n=1 Tax=Enterobacter hormaechei TaxID=158836 RepID=UPI0020064D73|nr:glycosyltransferase family 4 protein [Enterobacter hormaechei]MCE1408591.1 glycosyltransferase family 4 protein [Enterobacter hormaechei]MCK7394424.1 glycosyltransferase family 4 protein [Enterobacter hormaechei]
MFVIFVGPSSGKITGQSVAFNLIYKNFNGKKSLIDYLDFSGCMGKVLFHYFLSASKFVALNMMHVFDTKIVYITTSRTYSGFFRDSFFILFGRLFRAKIVNHLHGSDFIYFRNKQSRFIQSIIDFVYNKIDVSIVLTDSMKEQYSLYKNMRLQAISNCYSGLTEFSNKNILRKDEIQLVYLSNLMYSKGVLHLVRSVKQAHEKGISVRLILAGAICADEFYTEKQLSNLIDAEISTVNYIKHVGIVKGKHKNDLLLNADVFVLPTFYRSEAQPISIIEAMYYGCAIVTTNHNYLKDFVSDKNGLIVEKDSQQALLQAIEFIHENKTHFFDVSKNNMKLARAFYSPENYIKRLTDIITEE